MTLAVTEPKTQFGETNIETKAVKNGDSYVITGTKLFVSDAHIADWFLCLATNDNEASLFMIDSKSQGIRCNLLKTMASDKQCEVILDNVRVPATNILGEPGKGEKH